MTGALDVDGIARIREALHTIMWPSLVRRSSGSMVKNQPPPIPVTLDDGGEGLQLTVEDLTNDMALSLFTSPDGRVDDKELEALEKWLDEDDHNPWAASTSKSPPLEGGMGFEDDFADFVSAPVHDPSISTTHPSSSTPIDDGDDQLLPSESEIRAASSRIFASARDPDADNLGTFDLSLVFSALQAMKEEISGIEDEDERRKAAARAALGLVEGLDLDFGGDEPDYGTEASELGEEMRVE